MKRKLTLDGSFSVEASMVMPVVLIAVFAMIRMSFSLHDTVTANITADEAAEIYAYSSDDTEKAAAEKYGTARLEALFTGRKLSVTIDEQSGKIKASVIGDDKTRTYEANKFMPQTFMRKITVLEEIADKQ